MHWPDKKCHTYNVFQFKCYLFLFFNFIFNSKCWKCLLFCISSIQLLLHIQSSFKNFHFSILSDPKKCLNSLKKFTCNKSHRCNHRYKCTVEKFMPHISSLGISKKLKEHIPICYHIEAMMYGYLHCIYRQIFFFLNSKWANRLRDIISEKEVLLLFHISLYFVCI